MGGKRQAGEIVCEDTSAVNFFGGPNRPSFIFVESQSSENWDDVIQTAHADRKVVQL